MKTEIKEALALELTKSRMLKYEAEAEHSSTDNRAPLLWVNTYENALQEINEAEYQYCLQINSA